jgi:ectoine hydroxylase-related dioxygenase (phytanoyl-CoA dioxygenase family)
MKHASYKHLLLNKKLAYLISVAGWIFLAIPAIALLCQLIPQINWVDLSSPAPYVVMALGLGLLGLAVVVRRKALEETMGGRYLRREQGLLHLYDAAIPGQGERLQQEGHCVIESVFSEREINELRSEILQIFEESPADNRPSICGDEEAGMYRYQMFNRSPLCQKAIANKKILDVIEPLLGDDCHVIANTAWRNPPNQKSMPNGQEWHTDAGPHVPRPPGTDWPEEVPYPIFVIGVHIYLEDTSIDDGPTGVIPFSHTSGKPPPFESRWDDELTFKGHSPQVHIVKAGDVGMFVSDVWHRRTCPSENSTGRFFLQVNYGRRDIAQRILPSSEFNQASAEAIARAKTMRAKQLIGLHSEHFYDG